MCSGVVEKYITTKQKPKRFNSLYFAGIYDFAEYQREMRARSSGELPQDGGRTQTQDWRNVSTSHRTKGLRVFL
jgi:hypothetical protein